MARPIIIGVTGGIGAGKSTVVDAFARRGAVPFSADTAVHELYELAEVRDAVRERWGEDMFDESGAIDRASIAPVVFNDENERRWLEGLLHPLVGEAWDHFVGEQRALTTAPEFLVAEVPLLFEAGLEGRYDAVVTITAPFQTRIDRSRARGAQRGLERTYSKERAAAQMSEEEKVRRAHFAYDNTGSIDELDAFAGRVLDELRAGASG